MLQPDRNRPFIEAERIIPEITATSLILGALLALLFGAANAYLGMRVGMTVSASIPAAVLSMGIIRVLLRRDSILENNLVQTIGSAGESVAAGAIFTMPALFMWMEQWGEGRPPIQELALIAACGGVLGIVFMIPLRRALIVQEHGVLPYPEGTACAEVLLAGERGGARAGTVFWGLGIAAWYKLAADGLRLFPSRVHCELVRYRGGAVGVDVLPALLGVGYICSARVAAYLFAGGVLSWLALLPLLRLFGGETVLFPGETPPGSMSAMELWDHYVRYIGAGAVAAGGILSMVKSLPLIGRTFLQAMRGLRTAGKESKARTERDLPMKAVLLISLAVVLVIWLAPTVPVSLAGAVLIALFGFFFAAVSARLVGLVGSSNNPVSGMAIATLILSALLLKVSGLTGREGMAGAIAIGSVICIIAAIAGDTSQDLKTGYLLGATPRSQQLGELLGIGVAALGIGGVLYLLGAAWGYGTDALPAPQAVLMKLVVEGVMEGNLPWTLVLAGAAIAVAAELAGVPVLPFSVGLYLPFHLTTGIMAGGLLRLYLERRKEQPERRKAQISGGILYASGLIAGEGVVGVLLAVAAVVPVGGRSMEAWLDLSARGWSLGAPGALVAFALLAASLLWAALRDGREDA